MSIEAMKQALEALEEACGNRCNAEYNPCYARTAITALRQAIAEAEKQEPVAFEQWLANQHGDPEEIGFLQALRIAYVAGQDSITHPPKREPLTDEQIEEICWTEVDQRLRSFARAIEAAHGIKGEA